MKFINLKYFYKIHVLFLYVLIYSIQLFSYSANKASEVTHKVITMQELGFPKNYRISLRTDENQIGNGLWNIGIQVLKNNNYLNGSGVLVLVGNEIMVLTNSHNLLGEKKATGLLTDRLFSSISKSKIDVSFNHHLINVPKLELEIAKINSFEYDFPLLDFAILTIKNNLAEHEMEALKYYAAKNAQICPKGLGQCDTVINYLSNTNHPLVNSVNSTSFIEGEDHQTFLIKGFEVIKSNDTYVSGYYNYVYLIPNISIRGVSGGGFYQNSRFTGLVTRISTALEALTVAIPIDEIVRSLWSFENKKIPFISNWDFILNAQMGTPEPILKVKLINSNGKIILVESGINKELMSPASSVETISSGGETGSSTSSSGGETGSSKMDNEIKLWKIRDLNPVGYYHKENNITVVENPFSFSLNQSWLKVNGEMQNTSYLPTAAKFIFHLLNGSESHVAKSNKPIFKFARIYRKMDDQSFSMNTLACDNRVNDGAFALDPKFHLAPVYSTNVCKDLKKQFLDKDLDQEGYYQRFPLASKPFENLESNEILNLKIIRAPKNPENLILKMEKFEENIKINLIWPEAREAKEENLLLTKDTGSRKLYLSNKVIKKQSSRALIIYDSDDLKEISRVFIETPYTVIEVLTCTPGEDCVR